MQGKTSKEIAGRSCRTATSTVDFHRNNIRKKCRHQAARSVNLRTYLASLA